MSNSEPPRSKVPLLVLGLALVGILAMIPLILLLKKADHWEKVERARRFVSMGKPDLALRAVADVRDEAPGAAEALTIAGQILLQRGNIAAGRRVLERSLSMKDQQPDALKMLAAIYLASGDGKRGLALLEKAAALDPADFRPWYAMGKVHHDLGNLGESAESYAQALRRSIPPSEAQESRIGRIRALLDANHPEEATDELSRALAAVPEDPGLLALAARQARDLGQLEAAKEFADRALAADPDNFDALLVRARIRSISRETEKAVEDLERASRVRPNDLPTLQLLLQLQTQLGKADQAAATRKRSEDSRRRIVLMDQLTKTITARPNDPEPRWQMGQAAMQGEMFTLAFQCFQAALDLDPNFQPAKDSLNRLRATQGFDLDAVLGKSSGGPGAVKGKAARP